MGAYRASRPTTIDELSIAASAWFERAIEPEVVAGAVANMIANHWLAAEGCRLRPTDDGRRAARPLMVGLVRMLDQGTRLIDVALMMTVLRLSRGELDDATRDH